MQNDIIQNLPKIGPGFSHIDEKQQQVVSMIKRYEVAPQLKVRINQDIPGLRKKKKAFGLKPANKRLWASFASYERNGYLNIGLSRNWTRFAFPMLPLFWMMYMWQPIIHGNIYNMHYNNYQWEGVYYKYTGVKMVYTDQTITRLAWRHQSSYS